MNFAVNDRVKTLATDRQGTVIELEDPPSCDLCIKVRLDPMYRGACTTSLWFKPEELEKIEK